MHGWQKEIMAKSHFLTSKILGFIVLFISGGMITGSCSDLLCCAGQRLPLAKSCIVPSILLNQSTSFRETFGLDLDLSNY